MAIVVCLLRKAQVRCCFVGEAALIYYGAHRIMTDWILCIDDDQFDTAVALLELESKIVHPFRHSAMKPNGTIDHRFPRYKFTGARCFFHVVPSWVYRVSCDDDSIEFSRKGLPFPKLQVFAQSLLETMNRVDLQDLIDGMNLTYEWGLENLVLEGTSDTTWAARRCDLHEAYGDYLPAFLRREGAQRMQVWKRVASGDARAKRRGHKALPKDETRFRLKGQKDPRDLHMW
ncbi:unnamed protein product [Zymoseptoria tritici ST99CH_3D7]|uniref:Uncharacterized protein n=3 Tax=Zymoseptoria tritici TaxID=1047171 RepID=A0A1X7RK63_ZYMT9|nr:unnamed protein product [Zymoseptoria tritici ST99CH_3D7]